MGLEQSAMFTDGNAIAYRNTGANNVTPVPGVGCTLVTGGTYFFLPSTPEGFASLLSELDAQLKWDTAFVGSFVIETCTFPAALGGVHNNTAPADVTDIDVTKGNWLQQNPSGSYITVTSSDGTTGGATVTNATVTVAGGTAGGADLNLWAFASRRLRIRANVTTGGVVRCGFHGKAA